MKKRKFIVGEHTATANDRFRLFGRLLVKMKLFYKLLPLSIILLIAGLLVSQSYLWIVGQLSSCSSLPCSIRLPGEYGLVTVSLGFLGIMFLATVLIQLGSWLLFELSAQWSILELHDKMMEKISKVRTTFFDEHPSGRIINRLVRDFDILTMHVTTRFSDTLYYSLSILISVFLAFLLQPLILLLTIPALFLILYIQWHIALMNERVISERSAALSTVLHRETDLIEGGRVFTLYGALPALINRLYVAASAYVHFHLWQITLERYGRSLTGVLRVLFTGTVLLATLYSLKTGQVSEALALVLFSQLPPLQNKFGGLAWSWLNTVQSFATVRRIFEYVDLKSEESTEGKQQEGESKAFQVAGDISFDSYTMSYRPDLPNILENLSMVIPFGKRVALVGRTGSGKTSLMQALFRMVYVKEGDITIGGTSIYSLPMDALREHFVVVPQEPYLFAGTIRSNIDYRNVFDDSELDAVLQQMDISLSLDFPLVEGGENLSLGERQLLCLARALLSKAKYVIMDEPTSSVDSITDAKMQRIIQEAFEDRTLITIAHRLETIKDYDWIIELDKGKVVFEGTAEAFFSMRHALQPE